MSVSSPPPHAPPTGASLLATEQPPRPSSRRSTDMSDAAATMIDAHTRQALTAASGGGRRASGVPRALDPSSPLGIVQDVLLAARHTVTPGTGGRPPTVSDSQRRRSLPASPISVRGGWISGVYVCACN